jgi:hypothetical protein
MVITQQLCLASSMVIIQQQLLQLEVLMKKHIGVMLLAMASMNPSLIDQITQSSMVAAEVGVVVLNTVANTLVVVLTVLVAGDFRCLLVAQSVMLSSSRLISVRCDVLDA